MINKFSKIILFVILNFVVCTGFAQSVKQENLRINTIIIDPGHGGRDPGAVYGSVKEKDIALKIALLFGEMVRKNQPSVKVVYTRKTDVFIPLAERGIIANKAKGNLFISIHINAAANTAASGVEVYTLGLHKTAANLAVAQKENSVITLEENYEKDYGGFSPNDPESYIMFSMGQQGFMRESIEFSHILQENCIKRTAMRDRGLKQAGFLVLWRASMPSVLAEFGYLSNAKDRKYVSSVAGQRKFAESLYFAFVEYKKNTEKKFEYVQGSSSGVSPKQASKTTYYAVQLVSSKRKLKINKSTFGSSYHDVIEVKSNYYYKYFVGKEVSYREIVSLRNKIKKEGKFKDSYIVGFHKGKVVKSSRIKEILK